jgi:lipopolysaccharide export system protein LptC
MTRSLFGTPLRTLVKLGFLGVFALACEAGAGLARPSPPTTRAKAKVVGLSIDEWERGERRFSAVAARAEVELEPYRVTTGPVLAVVAARGETKRRRLVIEANGSRLGEGEQPTEFTGNVRVASDGVAVVAEKLVYDARRGAVRLEGGVKATGPRGRVEANRVAANLAADEATFEGNVRGSMLVE